MKHVNIFQIDYVLKWNGILGYELNKIIQINFT